MDAGTAGLVEGGLTGITYRRAGQVVAEKEALEEKDGAVAIAELEDGKASEEEGEDDDELVVRNQKGGILLRLDDDGGGDVDGQDREPGGEVDPEPAESLRGVR